MNLRNFELHGEKYGIPAMPQLGLEGFAAGDPRLNDHKFDELKIYYLTAGTERLMQIFEKVAQVNPNIYIVISNGLLPGDMTADPSGRQSVIDPKIEAFARKPEVSGADTNLFQVDFFGNGDFLVSTSLGRYAFAR